MRIIPNLFLQGNHVVSLYKGTENDQKKVYARGPKTYAAYFDQEGANTLFVVDLNGTERERLTEIRRAFTREIWWGGHIRDEASIEWLLNHGADRVILGQGANAIFASALARFGSEKLIAGIQVFHYDEVPTLCETYVSMGFKDIIVKDMNAEGTLFHPNFDLVEKCAYFSKGNIYASGGISEEHHLKLLREAGAAGAIIGRAFYEHQLEIAYLKNLFEAE